MADRSFVARRFPAWLRTALNLTASEIPVALAAATDGVGTFAPLQLTVEAYQGGIAIAQLLAGDFNLPNTSPGLPQTFDAAPSPQYGYLIVGVSLRAFGLGATRHVALRMLPLDANNGNKGTILSEFAVATGVDVDWKTIAGTADARIYVPPTFQPDILQLDLQAGEQIACDFTMLKVPAGFKSF